MILDLFKLHSKKDTPKSWIWVKFKPNLLRSKYLNLLRGKQQEEVAKEINKGLNAGLSTVVKHLVRLRYARRDIWLPLPITIKLVDYDKGLKSKILYSFEEFICKTNPTKQATKAIKKIDQNIAKIIGAFLADGYLQKVMHGYSIKISDGRRELIEMCSRWIKEAFSIQPIIRFDKRDDTWTCYFNSKIIGRYFENIINIEPGKKFNIAKEPGIIKRSNPKIRKSFVKGVMTFDGGVKASGMIALTSMSKQLIDDIYEILSLDGIKVNKRYNSKKGSWLIESKSGRDRKYLRKWLKYFEDGTWKHNRLKFFLNNRKYNIDELKYLFPKHHRSKICLGDVYNVIKKIKYGKINNIMLDMRNNDSNVANTTVYKYLYLLERSGLIYKEHGENKFKNNCKECSYYIK